MRSASTWLKEHNYHVWYYETHPHYIRHSTDERYRDEYPVITTQPKYTYQFEPDTPITSAGHYDKELDIEAKEVLELYKCHSDLSDTELQQLVDKTVQKHHPDFHRPKNSYKLSLPKKHRRPTLHQRLTLADKLIASAKRLGIEHLLTEAVS